MIKPPHPGETIKEDYLVPLGMSVNRLAEALGIGASRLNEIVRGKRGLTAEHRAASGTLLRNQRRVLAESPVSLCCLSSG
jgi:antitoxin component HigA of HigAB toxin-antitoxin module